MTGSNGMPSPNLGLRENLAQFSLLVLINAFVGGMVGLERAILPSMAEEEFGLVARAALLSFIVAFGLSKALSNYMAGRLSDRWGRKPVLVVGWFVALPVPFLLMWAPSWRWVVATNVLLGLSQGLTWSATVIMKIDLAGPKQRGLAMGLNEFAGYLAVGLTALATGYIAARYGLRPAPFTLGVVFAALGTVLSLFMVRETRTHAEKESSNLVRGKRAGSWVAGSVFLRVLWTDRELSAANQAGFVNNLNDGMAWGLFPLVFASAGMSLRQIGWLAAIYPAVWGLGQLVTGAASDHLGRKPLIVLGMCVQSCAIALIAFASSFGGFALAAILLGGGTAMVYPTLLAVIGDVADPPWRASAVGVYRLWRDSGYAGGALIAGVVADWFGVTAAVICVAGLTLLSGLVVQVRMSETLRVQR